MKPVSQHVIQTLRSLPREERQIILDALKGNWPARNDERQMEKRQYLIAELDKYRTKS